MENVEMTQFFSNAITSIGHSILIFAVMSIIVHIIVSLKE